MAPESVNELVLELMEVSPLPAVVPGLAEAMDGGGGAAGGHAAGDGYPAAPRHLGGSSRDGHVPSGVRVAGSAGDG